MSKTKSWQDVAKKTILKQVDVPNRNLIRSFNLNIRTDSLDIRPGCHFTMFPNVDAKLSMDGYDDLWTPPPPFNRMWKGGRIDFFTPLEYKEYQMTTELIALESKQTNRGKAYFTTLQKDITDGKSLILREVRQLVYLSQQFQSLKKIEKKTIPTTSRTVIPNSLMLFRFSALTFNSHFIHYDQEYCLKEGYEKPLVHGPLTVSLLLDLCLEHSKRQIKSFEYSCISPAFKDDPLHLYATLSNDNCALWATNHNGSLVLKGNAILS